MNSSYVFSVMPRALACSHKMASSPIGQSPVSGCTAVLDSLGNLVLSHHIAFIHQSMFILQSSIEKKRQLVCLVLHHCAFSHIKLHWADMFS